MPPLALQPPDPHILLRPVRLSDVDALAHDCWTDRPYGVLYDLVSRARRMEQERSGLGVIAESATHQVLGYGQVTMWAACAEITDMIVAQQQRNRGIGTAILQRLVQEARILGAPAVEIGAFLANPGAIRLYRRMGFEDYYTTMVENGAEGQQPALYLRLNL
jgi:GNAT superfamily N-acetyltransferase